MSKHNEYMLVDGTGMTVAAFGAMPKAGVKRIYAIGCTALTELHAPNAESIYAIGCTALTELHAPKAKNIYASGCTSLTELHAPKAVYITARGCTSLTEIHAPNVEYIDATGCTALTEIHAPNVEYIDATGCTALTELHAPVAERIYASGCTALVGAIHGGKDSRCYHFFGFPQNGKYRIFAGCRNFTPEEALVHWGPGGPSDRPDCLALVQKIITEIKMKEQA